jgi:hypothetical protein
VPGFDEALQVGEGCVKCLSSTRRTNNFWAWAIHLLQDIVIFSFILTGALG